jgi:hypothetical protein
MVLAQPSSSPGRAGRHTKIRWRLGVSPDNPDDVYFLAQAFYRSLDGGKTTTIIPENFPDHHDIWFDPTKPTASWWPTTGT